MSGRVVILGCGGHAKVVIEILEQAAEYTIHGCLGRPPAPETVVGYPVLGPDTLLPEIRRSGVEFAFVAIGDNALREKLMRLALESDFRLIQAVSRQAAVSPRARVSEGAAVMSGAVLNADSQIGPGAIINTGATVDHDCTIGACAHIAPGAHLAGNVQVGAGAFIGIGASVVPGIRIGDWAVIGAGAAVIRDIPPGAIVAGVPAAPIEAKRDRRE